MNEILGRYNSIIEVLNKDQRKYIHHKSLRNFILHLDELESVGYRNNIERKIDDYLDFIEQNANEIDRHYTATLFADYIFPIGEVYKKIKFRRIAVLENWLPFGIIIDCIVSGFLVKFPCPILTSLILLNYFFRQRKYYKANMVYGMFY